MITRDKVAGYREKTTSGFTILTECERESVNDFIEVQERLDSEGWEKNKYLVSVFSI